MGRGSSKAGGGGAVAGNINSAYTVTSNTGQTLQWYFTTSNGNTFYRNSIGAMPEPTPGNMTESEMISRVKANGGSAQKKTNAQIRREYSEYEKGREETNAFLNSAYLTDRAFTRGMRASRTTNRANRRRR